MSSFLLFVLIVIVNHCFNHYCCYPIELDKRKDVHTNLVRRYENLMIKTNKRKLDIIYKCLCIVLLKFLYT